jgi:pyrroloquinoline quinone biosynthesis protein D
MDVNSVPIPDKEFSLEELDNELLLYHPTKTTTVYMNETASIIWRLCDGKRSIDEITELIKESYPEAGDRTRQDVEATLRTFNDHGAIKI